MGDAVLTLEDKIREEAEICGFDAVGIASTRLPDKIGKRLQEFLAIGRHGDMVWMENRSAERADPTVLWPAARSAIMLGVNYGPERDPMAILSRRSTGAISVYAQNKDYHDIVKKRLKRLARWLIAEAGGEVKVFVDTAPIMEKPLAAKAGLGWQGKHTNLVSRAWGSWLFLGSIFTTLELSPDQQEDDHCGSCQNCLDICPTDAFPAPYQLDARRCISYLTIEHKGPIPNEFRAAMGNRIYGCDDCLAVCPWNKFAGVANDAAFHARDALRSPSLETLAQLDDKAFRKMFAGSPVKRTGRDRFIRNVLIAIGNSGDEKLLSCLYPLLDDDHPLVRGAAVWALRRLSTENEFETLKGRRLPNETDADVLVEWDEKP